MFRAIEAATEWFRNPDIELGEFSLHPEADELWCGNTDDPEEIEPETMKGEQMPRGPAKEKVYSVPATTVAKMLSWEDKLSNRGFAVTSYEYDGEGGLQSATCEKNGREQVITPELFEALTTD